MASHAVSGLAASIRNATESETFDLAGHSAANISTHMNDAFSTPLPLQEMIRLTFVTGAGKLGRQKYDEGAAKAVTSTLRELGFEEDRGASAVLECAGSFKLQHDTGKNLKTVVVFPLVSVSSDGDGTQQQFAGMSLNEKDGASQQLLAEGTPEHKLAFASAAVFERMVQAKCSSWSQKKACIAALDEIKTLVESLDAKLLSGTPLADAEQDFYDAVSVTSLQEKQALVREWMHTQVESGRITAAERSMLLHQVGERLQKLEKELEQTTAEKRKKALTAQHQKAIERQAMLTNLKLASSKLEPLKMQAAITKLRQELEPLLELEAGAKGRLLTLKESQAVARKDDLLEEIRQQEEASRGWFESDEAFEARLEQSRSEWNAKQKANKKKSGNKGAASSTSKWSNVATTANKWVTPGAASSRTKTATKSKPTKGKASGLFAAMMNDSDSD